MISNISPVIKEKAPLIMESIKDAKSILLHCHPSPDPDSVGSVLAMKFALEQLGKKVTAIRGDSVIPLAFMHFPGVETIVAKSFGDIDFAGQGIDLFIILDSGGPEQISRLMPVTFPLPVKTITIDHHNSNQGLADINLLEPTYPAVGQILFDLFGEWGIKLDRNIAANLFMAIYADTGGFKYEGTSEHTLYVASQLVALVPDFSKIISKMENSNTKALLDFEGIALSSVQEYLGGHLAIASVPLSVIQAKNIKLEEVKGSMVIAAMRRVITWDIVCTMIEESPNVIKLSFRTKDGDKYDLSVLTASLGGGGHKAAAGAVLRMPMNEAIDMVVAKVKELYNL